MSHESTRSLIFLLIGKRCTHFFVANILPRPSKLGPLVAPLSELFMGQSEAREGIECLTSEFVADV